MSDPTSWAPTWREHLPERGQQESQQTAVRAVDRINEMPVSRSVLLAGSVDASGSVVLFHRLGRLPTEWWIVDVDGDHAVYRTAWDENSLTLYNGGSAAVNLKVRVM